jgi:hypothetical protein
MATYTGLTPSSPASSLGSVAISGREAVPSSGGGGSDIPASLSNLVPVSGSELSPDSTCAFTLLDASTAQLVQVSFLFEGTEHPEIAYQNGAFLGRYKGVSDSYAVTGGTRFVFGRAGRWPSGSVTVRVTVVDSQGVVRYL